MGNNERNLLEKVTTSVARFHHFMEEYPPAFLSKANLIHYYTQQLENLIDEGYHTNDGVQYWPLQLDYPGFFKIDSKNPFRRSNKKRLKRTRYDLVWLHEAAVQERSERVMEKRDQEKPPKKVTVEEESFFFDAVFEFNYFRNGFTAPKIERMRRNLNTLALTHESRYQFMIVYCRITTKSERGWDRSWSRVKKILSNDRYKNLNTYIFFKNYQDEFITPQTFIKGDWKDKLEALIEEGQKPKTE